MKWLRDLPISTKLNAFIIGAVITIIIALTAIQLYSTDILISELGQLRLEQETRILESELLQVQNDLATASTVLANTPGLIDAVEENDVAAIRSLALSAVPSLDVDDFDIVNVDGERLIEPDNEAGVEQNALISQSLLGIQRTAIVIEEDGDEPIILLMSIRPFRDGNGAVIGGLFLTRELDDEFLSNLNFGRDGIELSLVYDNAIVSETFELEEDDRAERLETVNSSLYSRALNSTIAINPEVILLHDGENQIPFVEAYLPVQGLDNRVPVAVLAVRISNDTIDKFSFNLVATSTVALLVLSVVVVIVLAVQIRYTLTVRLRDLQAATTAIAKGDYARRATVSSEDEIGQLAGDFNRMAGEIQQRQTELQELNQTLENRVAERTLDLEKARDEALAAQKIASENSRLKSEFLSTMSHELRTPMNAIEGFTGIILNGMGGVEYNEKTGRYLKKVQSNSRRLLALINDFLDLSRIESGRMELVSLPMTPSMMAIKWEDNLSVLAQDKGLEFKVTVDPELPETIYGDEEALTKIAINLIGNAVKFTSEGSVTLSLEKREENMAMVVKDTGIGIPPHAREFIFDEFRQVDQSSKREYGGTGLGLSIVQKLVREMGGTVSLESEVGTGSTFTVLVPIHTEEKQIA